MGCSQKKKTKATTLIYEAMLHEDDVNTIADKFYDSMTDPIIAFKTAQDVMKKAIEAQLTELKSLVSHTPHVAIQTPV